MQTIVYNWDLQKNTHNSFNFVVLKIWHVFNDKFDFQGFRIPSRSLTFRPWKVTFPIGK